MKKNILMAVGFVLLFAGSFAVYHLLFKEKIGYVDLNVAYDKFEMKAELEKKMEAVSSTKKNILDSMKINLELNYKRVQSMGKNAKPEDVENFNYLKNEYYLKSQSFEESNQQMLEQYDKQIWTQLNQYVKDYGTSNNFSMILGANGSGSVMYGNTKMDVTEDVVSYINERHKGIK